MRKILLGLLVTGTVGAVVLYVTNSFFSDTETSTGNILQAGEIDLKINNESYIDQGNGLQVSETTTWGIPNGKDDPLGLFFNFTDLKPGDLGEDTISIHLSSNPAWLCADLNITANSDETCTEPENAAVGGENNACVVETNGTNGDLAGQLNFVFWEDDGDNVLEDNETILTQGPASNVLNGVTWAIADSQHGNGPLQPTKEGPYFIGKAWCFGTLELAPLVDGEGTPIQRGTGVTCDGSQVNNTAQTDTLMGDISFRAVQSRHNLDFVCRPLDEQRPLVGAALGAYVQPTGAPCNVNVPGNFTTIQGAIDDAGTINGETICVGAGTYPEDVVINKEITLAGNGASATSIINGQAGGQGAAVKIAANNVTLKGFQINGAGIAALWLNTGVSGATVESNKITSASGGVTAVTTQGSQSNHIFRNNEFVGTASGQVVYINGTASLGQASSNVDFDNNTFSGTIVAGGVALGNEATSSDITENKFASTLTSTYAILESWEDDANVNFNNFNGVGGIKVLDSDAGAGPLDAENNWWGAAVPAGHTAGNVDENPKEASAFPEN